MEAMIVEYAGLRVAKNLGTASAEDLARLIVLEDLLDESSLEDAEVRVAAVMPSATKHPGLLTIEAKCDGKVSKGVAVITEQLVMCGGCWWPGVVVEGFDDFTNEVIGYAMNEGGMLYDVIDGNGEASDVDWRVLSATSEDLARLRRLDAKLPKGSVIVTEDGYRLTVTADNTISDGDLTFTSMSQIAVSFVVRES